MSAFSLTDAKAEQYLKRAASYSTRGSRRGFSFLTNEKLEEKDFVSEHEYLRAIAGQKGTLQEIIGECRNELGIEKKRTKYYLEKFQYDEHGAPIGMVPPYRNQDLSHWNKRGYVKLLYEAMQLIKKLEKILAGRGVSANTSGHSIAYYMINEIKDILTPEQFDTLHERAKKRKREVALSKKGAKTNAPPT